MTSDWKTKMTSYKINPINISMIFLKLPTSQFSMQYTVKQIAITLFANQKLVVTQRQVKYVEITKHTSSRRVRLTFIKTVFDRIGKSYLCRLAFDLKYMQRYFLRESVARNVKQASNSELMTFHFCYIMKYAINKVKVERIGMLSAVFKVIKDFSLYKVSSYTFPSYFYPN